MLRIHFMQQRFGLSDPAMEEALFDVPMYREFAQLPDGLIRLPDESTILRFRHLLEKPGLAAQMFAAVNAMLGAKGLMLQTSSVIDATLIERRFQRITARARETWTCTRRRRGTTGTSA